MKWSCTAYWLLGAALLHPARCAMVGDGHAVAQGSDAYPDRASEIKIGGAGDCGGEYLQKLKDAATKAKAGEERVAQAQHDSAKQLSKEAPKLKPCSDAPEEPPLPCAFSAVVLPAAKSPTMVKATCDGKLAESLANQASMLEMEAKKKISLAKIKKRKAMVDKQRAMQALQAAGQEANEIAQAKMNAAVKAQESADAAYMKTKLAASSPQNSMNLRDTNKALQEANEAKLKAEQIIRCQQASQAAYKVTSEATSAAKFQADSEARQAAELTVQIANEAQQVLGRLGSCADSSP
jgi:hypothetical protein